jgi:hypothetical protein
MVSVSDIYNTVLSYSRKDKRGLAFSPDDFNNAIVQVNQRVYRDNYRNFESSKLSMDEMDSFKVVNYPINLDANGIGVIPSDYFHLVGDPFYIHATYGRRRVDLITSLEHGQREMDFLTKGTVKYPTCFMAYGATSEDMSVYVTPTTCTPIYIDYLRTVNTPFLDYYVNDTTLELTYMAEGATVAVPLGSTARNGTAGAANVVSQTKDFEWHEHDVPSIVNMVLEAIGISLPDELLIQVSNVDEPKIEKR